MQSTKQYKNNSIYDICHKSCRNCGFTIIELLITLAIIGILATIALPSYQNYTRKAHYTEIIQATIPYKLAVEICYQLNGELTNCIAGKNDIPQNINSGVNSEYSLISSLTVTTNGKITVVPNNKYGINSEDTYILSPIIDNEQLRWISSGGGVTKGYAH